MSRDHFQLQNLHIPTKVFDLRIHQDPSRLDLDSPRARTLFDQAATLLRQGKTVAFPTETVYGLGANALDEKAVSRIFLAKGRPSDNPLIVHIASLLSLKQLVREVPPKALLLMEAFWPGPLSIILQKTDAVASNVTAGLDTVAIRMPANPEARHLLLAAGCPVAAPSANLSGKPSPTRAEHVLSDLTGRADGLLLGGNCQVGLESTVIDMTVQPPAILRPGAVSRESLEAVLGEIQAPSPGVPAPGASAPPPPSGPARPSSKPAPKAPGMKYTHYAPEAPLHLVKGPSQAVVSRITALAKQALLQNKAVAVIGIREHMDVYEKALCGLPGRLLLLPAGSQDDLAAAAASLFDLLRTCDSQKIQAIFAEGFPQKGIGEALMNRLEKAADTQETLP